LLLGTSNALAYIGPMPGPEFFGYFLSLVGWVVVIFSSVLLWPIHAFLKRWRKTPSAASAVSPVEGPAVAEHPQP